MSQSHTESSSRIRQLEAGYDELRTVCNRLQRQNERFRKALHHIAWEPLTDDMEASDRACLDETARIAKEALSDEEVAK